MRKLFFALPIAAAVLATPALAQPYDTYYPAGPVVGGAAVGTVVGVGLYEGWFGSSAAVSALPATAAGAAATGGVAGIGTIALIDAAVQPCRGFQAIFGMNRGQCANGQYVGYAPQRDRRVIVR
ncbi:MAG: hypothetical protein ACK4UO_13460 [Pseudolabrys sp.]